MIYKTTTISYDVRIRAFWSLVSLCLFFSALYIYAIASTVGNTAQRESLENENAILSAELGEMEFRYISMKNGVSIELAKAHGFQEVTSPVYVSRVRSHSLSANIER